MMRKDVPLYSDPVNYLLSVLEKEKGIDPLFVFHQLQGLANQFLFLFLNGEYNSRWEYYFPSEGSQKRLSNSCQKALHTFRVICAYLNKSGFSFNDSTKDFNMACGTDHLTQGQAARLISTLYGEIDQNIRPLPRTKHQVPRHLEFDELAYDTPFLRPVLKLKSYAESHLIPLTHAIYLHGSISTLDYVPGWSDLDTLVVVSKKTLMSPKDILRLKKNCISLGCFCILSTPCNITDIS